MNHDSRHNPEEAERQLKEMFKAGGKSINVAEGIGVIERQGFVWMGWPAAPKNKRGRQPKTRMNQYERAAFVRQLNVKRWAHKILTLPNLRKGKGRLKKREEIKKLFLDILQIRYFLQYGKPKIQRRKLVTEAMNRLEREGRDCYSRREMQRIRDEVLQEYPQIYQ